MSLKCVVALSKSDQQNQQGHHCNNHNNSTVSVSFYGLSAPWPVKWWIPIHSGDHGSLHTLCIGTCHSWKIWKNCSKVQAIYWSSDLDSPRPFTTTRAKNLRISCSIPSKTCVESNTLTQLHINSEGNGQVGHFNRTPLSMLRTLQESQKSRWWDHLNKMVQAYNCTCNDLTGFFLFYLLFWRNPRQQIDPMFGLKPRRGYTTYQEYVKKWRSVTSSNTDNNTESRKRQ